MAKWACYYYLIEEEILITSLNSVPQMTDLQNERAFQKQDGVFLASKKVLAKKTTSGVRFYKKIGLGK